VTLIDTADVYSAGVSEEFVGHAVHWRRNDVLLATKARFTMGEGVNDKGLSRHHLIRACEASLRRLQTDHIDLYQVHEWDGRTPLEETLSALDHLVQSGKVRYVGCSNFTAWQMVKALGIAEIRGLPRFISTQVYYSLQERSLEHEILPACIDQGVGVLVWSPLAGGLLSGKYRRGQQGPEGSRHVSDWSEPPVYDADGLYDTIDVLVEIAEGHGVSAAQVALAWLLRRPGISTVVIGARDRRAARRQPAGRGARALRRGGAPARGGQPATAAVPALAPGEDGGRPARAGRPRRPTPPPGRDGVGPGPGLAPADADLRRRWGRGTRPARWSRPLRRGRRT
jgi:aryl-alcohol dehydrogenase-like predicted oxidoreductase